LSSDPVDVTKALTIARARQLIAMPSADSLLDSRDRAILRFYIFTGARLASGCHRTVSDFQSDETGATIRLREKGDRRRTMGLHVAVSQAIQEYLDTAQITSGALFRAQKHSRSEQLGEHSLVQRGDASEYSVQFRDLPNDQSETGAFFVYV
jgi:site-specific recombinase XerD